MIARRLFPQLQRSTQSILLLGPRQTGKSTLVAQLTPDLTINLFHEPTYLEFARNPNELEERLAALSANGGRQSIFIDEVHDLEGLVLRHLRQVGVEERDRLDQGGVRGHRRATLPRRGRRGKDRFAAAANPTPRSGKGRR